MNSNETECIMLAAGIGSRLSKGDQNFPPKCLLKFDNKSLLEYHIDALVNCQVKNLTIVVGFSSEKIIREVDNINTRLFINFIDNDQFEKGSIISLWCARDRLRSGNSILFMDADVLYHPSLVKILTKQTNNSIVPFDRNFEPGTEPVKVCLKDEKPICFSKLVDCPYDKIGEWPGFMRLSTKSAQLLADDLDIQIASGNASSPYEDCMQRVLLQKPDDEFEFLDITGLPWIEIDFPEDVEKAQSIILPAISNFSE